MFKRSKPSPFLMLAKDGIWRVYDIAGHWYPYMNREDAQEFLDYLRETETFNPLSAGFKTPMDLALAKIQAMTELSVAGLLG